MMACNIIFLGLQGVLQFFNFVSIVHDVISNPAIPSVEPNELDGSVLSGSESWFGFQNVFGRYLNSGVVNYFTAILMTYMMFGVTGKDAETIALAPIEKAATVFKSTTNYILGDNPHFAVGILCCPCFTVVIVLVVLMFLANLATLLIGIPSLITHLFPMLVCDVCINLRNPHSR